MRIRRRLVHEPFTRQWWRRNAPALDYEHGVEHLADETQPEATVHRQHLIVTLRLPDRPGALGAVASRIGAVGADITDVRVSSRTGGIAEDVFHLDLPDAGGIDTVGLLLAEIRQVDGVVAPSLSYPPLGCCR